jgi:membrane-bound metal-dependent hydrolase YbcI (DUF457 family)
MPITPFHFGPAVAVHAISPSRVSFLSFCASNVLIDVEPLYYRLTDQYPLHRFFHTYIGASLVGLATVLLFLVARRVASPLGLPNVFHWRDLGIPAVALGAFIGTFSHVALDSVMHADMRPFAPFSGANPLLHVVSLSALHWACLAAAVIGAGALWVRQLARSDG